MGRLGETEDRKQKAKSEFQCLNCSGKCKRIAILALRWYAFLKRILILAYSTSVNGVKVNPERRYFTPPSKAGLGAAEWVNI
jgi:hypothetical protein